MIRSLISSKANFAPRTNRFTMRQPINASLVLSRVLPGTRQPKLAKTVKPSIQIGTTCLSLANTVQRFGLITTKPWSNALCASSLSPFGAIRSVHAKHVLKTYPDGALPGESAPRVLCRLLSSTIPQIYVRNVRPKSQLSTWLPKFVRLAIALSLYTTKLRALVRLVLWINRCGIRLLRYAKIVPSPVQYGTKKWANASLVPLTYPFGLCDSKSALFAPYKSLFSATRLISASPVHLTSRVSTWHPKSVRPVFSLILSGIKHSKTASSVLQIVQAGTRHQSNAKSVLLTDHCGPKWGRSAPFVFFLTLFTTPPRRLAIIVPQKSRLLTSYPKNVSNALLPFLCGTQPLHFVRPAPQISLLGMQQRSNAKNAKAKSRCGISHLLDVKSVQHWSHPGIKQQNSARNAKFLCPHGMQLPKNVEFALKISLTGDKKGISALCASCQIRSWTIRRISVSLVRVISLPLTWRHRFARSAARKSLFGTIKQDNVKLVLKQLQPGMRPSQSATRVPHKGPIGL